MPLEVRTVQLLRHNNWLSATGWASAAGDSCILGDRNLYAACSVKKGNLCFIPITTGQSQMLCDQRTGEHTAYIECPSGEKMLWLPPTFQCPEACCWRHHCSRFLAQA